MTFLSTELIDEISKESSGGRYLNAAKLTGERRVRFVGEGITGVGGWYDKKPLRFEEMPEELPELDPDYNGQPGTLRRFIASVIWDYEDQEFKIWEITQRTIMDQLFKYMKDSDYGDPNNYDVKVDKSESSGRTKYTLVAAPPKPLPKTVASAYEQLHCNLRALFDGEDPWKAPAA